MNGRFLDISLLADDLVRDEGLRLVVYDDATGLPIVPATRVVGHPTIGAGRTLDIKGLSPTEARTLLHNDIMEYLDDLDAIPWFATLDPERQRAIVNMRHQLGLRGLLGFRDMIAALQADDWAEAARAGTDSEWFRSCPARASRLMRMIAGEHSVS